MYEDLTLNTRASNLKSYGYLFLIWIEFLKIRKKKYWYKIEKTIFPLRV